MIPFQVKKWPENSFVLPRYQTHRGYWIEGIQENTLESLREAKKRGSEMCEVDVRLSKDGIPVLIHDSDLLRIRDLPDSVYDLTADELMRIAQIPTLERVLKDPLVTSYLNIEIKTEHFLNDRVERKVAQVVQQTRSQKRVLFSSFNPFSLWKLSHYLPQVPRALLVTDEDDPENSLLLKKMVLAPIVPLHLIHLDEKMVNPDLIQKLKHQGLSLGVWTVNQHSRAEELFSLGIDTIITDHIWL
ncbi:MAG: glycerophosphoryl diester phosphodiesterase [Oligoflexia bacterium]|nr:MAG: glycerophosphoryl diester phosphodiesterase [Oligoflexia bacterium]